MRFGFSDAAAMRGSDFEPTADGCRFTVHFAADRHEGRLRRPGGYNAMTALAAIAAARAINIPVTQSVAALAGFVGLARRYEVLGQAGGVTVIDDFAHNPDKVAATLSAVAELPGRALLFFQPHGYGPLKQMGKELATRSEAHTSELQSLMRSSYAVYGLK